MSKSMIIALLLCSSASAQFKCKTGIFYTISSNNERQEQEKESKICPEGTQCARVEIESNVNNGECEKLVYFFVIYKRRVIIFKKRNNLSYTLQDLCSEKLSAFNFHNNICREIE